MEEYVNRINNITISDYNYSLTNALLNSTDTTKNFLDFISPVDAALDKIYLIQHLKNFDPDWHNASLEYVKNLPMRDRYMLYTYTHNGDELINEFIRNPDGFETNKRVLDLIDRCILKNENNIIAIQLFEANRINPSEYLEVIRASIKPRITNDGKAILSNYLGSLLINTIAKYINQLAFEIQRIIRAAPPLTKRIKLFRGITPFNI